MIERSERTSREFSKLRRNSSIGTFCDFPCFSFPEASMPFLQNVNFITNTTNTPTMNSKRLAFFDEPPEPSLSNHAEQRPFSLVQLMRPNSVQWKTLVSLRKRTWKKHWNHMWMVLDISNPCTCAKRMCQAIWDFAMQHASSGTQEGSGTF